MERKLDNIMFREVRIGKFTLKVLDICFIAVLLILSFLIRKALFPIESADYYGFLANWMEQIRANGGLKSLKSGISNYSSMYNYIMCIISYFDVSSLYSLKMVSVIFDYIAAFVMFFLVYDLTDSVKKSVFGMGMVLLAPNVILDSAYWCQCDIIYTSFLLLSLYFFLKGDSTKTMIFFGISFAFKLQSLFLLPFFIIMWLKNKTVKLWQLVFLPVIFFISVIPAWLFGRSLKELLTIYTSQAGYYPWGTLEYPNIYAILGEMIDESYHYTEVSKGGIFLTIAILGCLSYYLYVKRIQLNNKMIITIALLSVAIMVYCLPHMHERYGFLIDLLAIVYCSIDMKKIPLCAGFIMVSVFSYMPYLTGTRMMQLPFLAFIMLGLIAFVAYDLRTQVNQNIIEKRTMESVTRENLTIESITIESITIPEEGEADDEKRDTE